MSKPVVRELFVVAALVVTTFVLRATFPTRMAVGDLLLLGAAILLGQGLVRDLVRVYQARKAEKAGEPPRVTCFCVESTLGVTSIVAGIALSFGLASWRVTMAPLAWPIALAALMLFGTATRNLVLDWRARKIRVEANHGARVALR